MDSDFYKTKNLARKLSSRKSSRKASRAAPSEEPGVESPTGLVRRLSQTTQKAVANANNRKAGGGSKAKPPPPLGKAPSFAKVGHKGRMSTLLNRREQRK